jgi:zinc transport system substrate-binding protein
MRYIIALLLTSTAAQAEVPAVVTDIPPVDALVAAVMGDLGQPTLLLDRGASAHSFALRPSQAAALANADLVVWIGPELTPWLATALGSLGETAARLDLLDAPGTERQDFAAKDDHHHDNETEAEDATQGHDHAGIDPHAWLDPDNARLWLGLIAAELARLDPEHAAIYTENATAATAAVDRAEAEADALLAPVKDRPFLAFHDAYGYFTAHYGGTAPSRSASGRAPKWPITSAAAMRSPCGPPPQGWPGRQAIDEARGELVARAGGIHRHHAVHRHHGLFLAAHDHVMARPGADHQPGIRAPPVPAPPKGRSGTGCTIRARCRSHSPDP